MRHELGFQSEPRLFRQVQSITNSEFSISDLSSFGEEESSFPVWSSAELDFDDGKPVQSNSFSRSTSDGVLSISSGVVIGMDPFDVIRASVRHPNDEMSARMG